MPKILIVEDDKLLLRVYRVNFSAKGFQVDIAQDGQEALSKIKKNTYDLILLDLKLPKLSGQKFLKIAQEKNLIVKRTPVVVLSNVDEKETVEDVISLGVAAYLYKDKLNPQSIVSEVEKYIN